MSELPLGWIRSTVGAVTQPVETVNPKLNPEEPFKYVDIGSIDNSTKTIVSPKELLGATAPSRARQLLREGDTVFSTVRTYLRNIGYVTRDLDGAIASTGFSVLRPASGVSSRYLYYHSLTNDFVDGLSAVMRGTSYPAVVDSQVRQMPIPIAPAPEQERVVAAIEEQFSRLDAGVAVLRRVRQNLKRLRASVLQAAVTGRLVAPNASEPSLAGRLSPPDVHTPLHERQPANWITTSMSAIARVTSGATPSRSRAQYWENGSIPWVTSTLVNQETISAAREFVTPLALKETPIKLMPTGTILVAMYGEGQTRGRCSELLIEATTNQACAAIVLHEPWSFTRPFLKLVLKASYETNRRLSAGGVQPNLSVGIIKNLPVSLPPPNEQARICEEADRRLSLIDQVDEQLEVHERRASSLRSSILARAFSGRLVRQDPSDEPAAMLLDHIVSQRAASNSGNRTRARSRSGKAVI